MCESVRNSSVPSTLNVVAASDPPRVQRFATALANSEFARSVVAVESRVARLAHLILWHSIPPPFVVGTAASRTSDRTDGRLEFVMLCREYRG